MLITPFARPQVAFTVVSATAVGAGKMVTVDVVVEKHPPGAVTVCVIVYVPGVV
jgi:hypothetical protein